MKLFQVDAFTSQAFHGNPAGVCLLEETRPDSWMLSVAQEMNLSETAFITREPGGFRLRWFTPKKEVSLCGHATLASAHILWAEKWLQPAEEAHFITQSGLLIVRQTGEWIEMEFPAKIVQPAAQGPELCAALGFFPCQTSTFSSPKGDIYLLEAESEAVVRDLRPNFDLLLTSPARVVIVTAPSSNPAYDFVSRYFAPKIGILEDPVTGSAHCYLAPYWGSRLNKTELRGFQVSTRSGMIFCRWADDQVFLRGQAVTIFSGNLLV